MMYIYICIYIYISLVGMKLVKKSRDFCANLPLAESAILEITFDETEVIANVSGQPGLYHLCMVHAYLVWKMADGTEEKHELPMAPAFMFKTTAEYLLGAIINRLPFKISDLKRKVKRLNINIGSDSAKACKRLGRYFRGRAGMTVAGDGITALHALCMMHATHHVVVAVLAQRGLLTPMFCVCVLLQQVKVLSSIRKQLHTSTRDVGSPIVYDPPTQARISYVRALIGLTEWKGEQDFMQGGRLDAVSQTRRDKAKAMDIAAIQLAGSTFEGDAIVALKKYCAYGCCASADIALCKLKGLVDKFVLPGTPGVPACNRWEKVFSPLCYIATATRITPISLAIKVVSENDQKLQEDGALHPIGEDDLAGPGDDSTCHTGRE
jgi:hypothetical protein